MKKRSGTSMGSDEYNNASKMPRGRKEINKSEERNRDEIMMFRCHLHAR